MNWETVIGLEVHVQLDTRSKLFCGCSTAFGGNPNTQVCPVCLGLPGALPVTNAGAVAAAVRAAVALGSEVRRESVFVRKNYFYPDLPKGYQITQYDEPLAVSGSVTIVSEGRSAQMGITRLHLEEDAGKSLHGLEPGCTAVDFNRAGLPLAEIVSEPDLRSPAEARAYLEAVKRILQYAGVSRCNMEEGNLRVDANVSVRPVATRRPGVKQEIKNLNSFSGVERSLTEVRDKQIEILERGGTVEQLTFSGAISPVVPMRTKEGTTDYRYFPDPDLPPLVLQAGFVDRVRGTLPELPAARSARLAQDFRLSPYQAGVLTADREVADYFEAAAAAARTAAATEVANWVMNDVLGRWDASGAPVSPGNLGRVADLVATRQLSRRAARQLLDALASPGETRPPAVLLSDLELALDSDEDRLRAWVAAVVEAHPGEIARLNSGEDRLLDFLVGKVMAASRGRADPRRVRELLQRSG